MEHTVVERLHIAVVDLTKVLERRLDDHDLLIKMATRQEVMHEEMSTIHREQLINKKEQDSRLAAVERKIFYAAGAVAMLVGLLKMLGKF